MIQVPCLIISSFGLELSNTSLTSLRWPGRLLSSFESHLCSLQTGAVTEAGVHIVQNKSTDSFEKVPI